ncbi:leucine-rich repeat domain-containing protein, partial [Streptomyces calidiresistens]|nr:leucine-rich repeat domain-containing protein [Streptomyces calidiresistens]
MTINEHVRHFHGLPVHEHVGGDVPLPDPASVAWRVRADVYGENAVFGSMEGAWGDFSSRVDLSRVRALVIGTWGETWDKGPEEVIATLVGAAPRLSSLEALFLGDIVLEESELSWIQQGDPTPLLRAFPGLRELRVRGGEGLAWEPGRHERLERLTIETAGMGGR